jgi:hypothetical protein
MIGKTGGIPQKIAFDVQKFVIFVRWTTISCQKTLWNISQSEGGFVQFKARI